MLELILHLDGKATWGDLRKFVTAARQADSDAPLTVVYAQSDDSIVTGLTTARTPSMTDGAVSD